MTFNHYEFWLATVCEELEDLTGVGIEYYQEAYPEMYMRNLTPHEAAEEAISHEN